MAYKPIMTKFCLERNKNLIMGKDTVLLAQHNGKYYEVGEHICLLTKIYPKSSWSSEVPEVELRFQSGKSYRTRAYIDANIVKNSFVSIYGIFTPLENGELEFTCKGGMIRAFDMLGQAVRVNPRHILRFGLLQLSKAVISTRYPSNLKGIEILEENMLWIYSSKNLEKEQQEWKTILEEEESTIDFTGNTTIFIKEPVEIESELINFQDNVEENINFQMEFINPSTYINAEDE